ncbi:hypothetical protein ACSSOE_10925 [Intestinibacter bartlettii]|jgi:hypothetical protein|uniref:hypothetical protein n=1 Tax=Intestinibacter bartlettii TaxID=261299 RepID=UPI00403E30F7
MNKRIKIKKGIWHKECDCRCDNFIRILRGSALLVFNCKNCNLRPERVRNVILTMLDEDEEIQEYTYREEAIKTMYKERVVNPIINAMKNHNYRKIILPIYVPGVKIKDIDIEFIKRQIEAKGLEIIKFELFQIEYRYTYNMVVEIKRKDVTIYDHHKQNNIIYLIGER